MNDNPDDNDPIEVACVVGGSVLFGPIGGLLGLAGYHIYKNLNR